MDDMLNVKDVKSAAYDVGRYCVIILALDKSGSMTGNSETVYHATMELLQTLAKMNQTALDFEYRVVLMTFDTEVNVLNPDGVPLPPEHFLELFTLSDYVCRGGTSLAAVFKSVDSLFSRKNHGLLAESRKGDALPLVLYISDYMATDAQESYDAAKDVLLANRYYQKTNRLCIFLGPEHKRNAAAELVGSDDNVVALSQNLEMLLTPVIIDSSIIMADATHIGNTEKTPKQVAQEQREKSLCGEKAAENLTEEELMEEMKKIFGDMAGGNPDASSKH